MTTSPSPVTGVSDRLRASLALVLSIASLLTAVLVPIYRFSKAPSPFGGEFTTLEIGLPVVRVKPAPKTTLVAPTQPPRNDTSGGSPSEVLLITIDNRGTETRHDVGLRIPNVRAFTGVHVKALPQTINVQPWLEPTYVKSQQELVFQPIEKLPVDAHITLTVWLDIEKIIATTVDLRSAEGQGHMDEGKIISGWGLFWALNIWWFGVVAALAIAIVSLRRFEERRQHGPKNDIQSNSVHN